MQPGQKVKLTRPIWGHPKGTAGRVTKTLAPDDSQTKINKYVGQVKFRGSPKMYVQHGDVAECASSVVAHLLDKPRKSKTVKTKPKADILPGGGVGGPIGDNTAIGMSGGGGA